ncbi:elongation of fatty acids protein 3-like [Prosopis cineraria]|uniref:elongation of fatty acids protein 3-like n=1 Tax=Prosopis cineraria TaxID=364024 RepID=UPI00240FE559|nr:elongation of fatty acids protein 3-like [Prosopis cineraria]XP_054804353.1 elongation of fatty acids protein 3-like [Prosopis cineraria]
MSQIFSAIEYYLVRQPSIENFTWIPNQTLASSPQFIVFTVVFYLCFTFSLSRHSLPPVPPAILKPITAIHSTFLLVLSFIMALGCLLSTISHAPHFHWIICFPPNTPPSGAVFFWAYVFYLSKILEFVDTFLIILSGSIKRLTFLHVYHHSAVVVMCYIWLETSQSLFPVVLVTNASVHVLMYTYYLSCALGVRPTWKKLVTDCQIVQFYSSFLVLSLMLWYHFSGSGCSGVLGWSFNVVFYASLLILFVDFHKKNYGSNSKKTMMMEDDDDNVKTWKPLIYSIPK